MRSLLDLPEDFIRPRWRTLPVPGRPWWSSYLPGFGHEDSIPGFVRVDGAKVDGHDVERCAAHDAEHPLPHPGLRVGQVWCFSVPGRGFVTVQIHDSHRLGSMMRGYTPEGHWIEAYNVCHFLLHDPIRPDLAPWSSR